MDIDTAMQQLREVLGEKEFSNVLKMNQKQLLAYMNGIDKRIEQNTRKVAILNFNPDEPMGGRMQ
jgi:hypothetical protein